MVGLCSSPADPRFEPPIFARGLSSLLESHFFEVAEREGFEPPVPFGTTVFKTAAFDHSAISP